MANVTIEYSAYKMDGYDKAFKPSLYINGEWVYTISRARKSMRGALNEAKRIAEDHARQYPKQYNNVTVAKREN